MAFILSNLKNLTTDMKNHNETRTVFPYEFNGKNFSCIYLIDIVPYVMFVTSLGAKPLVLDLKIDPSDYSVSAFFETEKYTALRKHLELKFDPEHKFSPVDFLHHLNNRIPEKFSRKPSYSVVLSTASTAHSLDEPDKVYFCGWRNNPPNEHVGIKNLQKTKLAFGDKFAELSLQKNLSSRWTSVACDEKIAELNNIFL